MNEIIERHPLLSYKSHLRLVKTKKASTTSSVLGELSNKPFFKKYLIFECLFSKLFQSKPLLYIVCH